MNGKGGKCYKLILIIITIAQKRIFMGLYYIPIWDQELSQSCTRHFAPYEYNIPGYMCNSFNTHNIKQNLFHLYMPPLRWPRFLNYNLSNMKARLLGYWGLLQNNTTKVCYPSPWTCIAGLPQLWGSGPIRM